MITAPGEAGLNQGGAHQVVLNASADCHQQTPQGVVGASKVIRGIRLGAEGEYKEEMILRD